jgi:hypothetical protein
MVKMNLQLFADEQGTQASGGDVTGGMQAGQAAEQTQQLTPFQQMIQGEGKAEYEQAVGQRVKQAIAQRFKNKKDMQEELNLSRAIMAELGKKYQLDPKDVKGIYTKMTDDLDQYREEADKLGYTPEAVRSMHKMAREVEQAKENEKLAVEELGRREHFLNLAKQGEELKKTFPSFDLMEELKNPRFLRMTSQNVGISVKDAFYAIHGEEIQKQTMQYTAQQAGQRIAASVQAGASRPVENGMQRQNPVNMGVDIAHMDKKTREEYRRRINNGEYINFTTKL